MRSGLHRIAVNGCLNYLRDRGRRPREVPLMPQLPEPTRMANPVRVEPYPDALLDGLPDAAFGCHLPCANTPIARPYGMIVPARRPDQRHHLVLRQQRLPPLRPPPRPAPIRPDPGR